MTAADFARLEQWFSQFTAGFADLDPEGLRNIRLKEEHTRRVVACMAEIAAGEGLDAPQTLKALSIALLHDVGRFPQYRRWRTFRDSESDNHARLSVEVIRKERLLSFLSEEEQLEIEEAVRFHNLLELPQRFASSSDRFTRLIRDADKLDIWWVFLEYYRQPQEERASAVGLGFPDLPEVTPACLDALAAGEVVRLEQARVLNDFKLLQISWVYDLNFSTTRRLLRERAYLEQLAATLPDSSQVQAAVRRAVTSLEVV
ncbi:MAG: HD domain-containing protein [Geobacter sp.]|nr:HD domain-containing protein [Geobacter sp.]